MKNYKTLAIILVSVVVLIGVAAGVFYLTHPPKPVDQPNTSSTPTVTATPVPSTTVTPTLKPTVTVTPTTAPTLKPSPAPTVTPGVFVGVDGYEIVAKTALIDAISQANTNKGTAVASVNSTDVYPAAKWVTQDVMAAYNTAITTAQAVAADADATQAEVDNAVTALATATGIFNIAKADGIRVLVSAITVTPTTMTLTAGGATGTLTKTVTPADATNQTVTWSSSNTSIATVVNGVVTPVAAGAATITATSAADGTKTGTCVVTVNAALPAMTGTVVISGAEKFGQILTATPTLTNAGTQTYQWNRGGVAISGATGTTYSLIEADITKILTATATADGIAGTGSITSAATGAVAKADGPALTGVTIDDAANTVTGMAAGMEFSTDGSTWTAYNEGTPNLPGLTGTVALRVRVAETATHEAGAATTFNFTVPTLSSIEITTPATKTAYKVDETLDITGMAVTGTYSDSTTKPETVVAGDVSGFDSAAVAVSQTLTVTVGGKTTTYDISVAKADGPALSGVTSNDAANTVTGMAAGMEFSTDGSTWTAYNEGTPNLPGLTGTVALRVRVAATATHEAGAATTFNFTVPTLESIAITTQATKTAYKVGETLDIAGMVVTGTYSDATTKPETVVAGDVSGFDSTAVAVSQTLTVTVGGKTTTYDISVAKALLIGDSYGGGKVAYLLVSGDPGYDANVQHGLIAATADQSPGIIWAVTAYQSTSVPGTLTTLGSGAANTDKIITQNGGVANTYAAGVARGYNGGGYNDWYLPSKDELYKLYLNQGTIGNFTTSHVYWSSSESNLGGSYAFAQVFDSYQPSYAKTDGCGVRAVRAF